MFQDAELYLTPVAGQAIVDDAYGSVAVDMKGAGEAAVGEPLDLCFQIVTANAAALTSLDVKLVADTDGAGGSEIELITKNFLAAALTVAKGVRRLRIPPYGAERRYMRLKYVVNGANENAAFIKAWLQKGDDTAPYNDGVKIGSV